MRNGLSHRLSSSSFWITDDNPVYDWLSCRLTERTHIFFLSENKQRYLIRIILKGRSGNKLRKSFESTEAQVQVGLKSSGSRIEGTRSSEAFLLPKATGAVAIVDIIAEHLYSLVWDIRCHYCSHSRTSKILSILPL